MAALCLLSCTKERQEPAARDLEGTVTWFQSPEQASFGTYYKPAVGNVADPMPFYDDVSGEWKIMYLQDFNPNQVATYHPFWAVSTKDAASYTSLGELLHCGGENDQDAALGTGSVIYNSADGLYYVFYTGNKHNPSADEYAQAVLYATSSDFKTWTKNRSFILTGAQDGYSHNDFRDPAVFADESGLYHLVISTSRNGKGVLAEYTSSDLKNWEYKGDFMTMMWDRFYECPDIFKMGDWWYLVYSELHSAVRKVQYFKSQTLDGLKSCTKNDAGLWPDDREGFLDSRGFYAGKTASDGKERYIWGWCAERPGSDNTKFYGWGGALVAHKLQQNSDNGTLVCVPVPAIADKFKGHEIVPQMKVSGEPAVTVGEGSWTVQESSYALFGRLGTCNSISFTARPSSSSDCFGISFSRGSDSEKFYSLVFNPESPTLCKVNFEEEDADGNRTFIGGSDSIVFSLSDTYDIRIYTDNSVLTMYVNDTLAYTCRIYSLLKNPWSVNAYSGSVTITDLKIAKY